MLVYKITNLVNNKCYIGSTNNFERRMNEHFNSARLSSLQSYNFPLQKAIRKYGPEKFKCEILEDDISAENIADRERYYIELFHSLASDHSGYNQTLDTYCALRDPAIIQDNIERVAVKCVEINPASAEIITYYDSLHDAARQIFGTDSSASTIQRCCEGKIYACHGHVLRYYRDGQIIQPEYSSRNRYAKVCGINIFNHKDIIYFKSISEAARQTGNARTALQKCIAGSHRYACIGERIWRKVDEANQIIHNNIDLEQILLQHSGYGVKLPNNELIKTKTIAELGKITGCKVGMIRYVIVNGTHKLDKYLFYKLDLERNPIE